MEFELSCFGLKDRFVDLKADTNFIVNYKVNDTHVAFYKCLRKREVNKRVGFIKFTHKEMFGENTKEW